MTRLSSLSIVFPSYNDAQVLPRLIRKADNVAQKVADRYEIIVINDASPDNTAIVLNRLKKKYPHLKTIHHKKNLGYGGAVASGLKQAKYAWVFYADGDGQYDAGELTKLVAKLKAGIDVVNGYKLRRQDFLIRRSLGTLYNIVLHRMYSLPIQDVDCDFRLIRQSLLDKIELSKTSAVFCLELVTKLQNAGARFAEVGVHHYKRPYGKSQFFKLRNIIKTIYENVIFFINFRLKRTV